MGLTACPTWWCPGQGHGGGGSNRHQELPRCYQQSTQHRRPGRAGGAGRRGGWELGQSPPHWHTLRLDIEGALRLVTPLAGCSGAGHWGPLGSVCPPWAQHSGVRAWGALGMVLPKAQQGQAAGGPQPPFPAPLLLARPRDGCWGRGMWGVVPGRLLATGLLATLPPGPVAWQRPRGDEWPSIPNEMGGGQGGRTPSTQGPSPYTLHCPGGA